MADNSSSSSSSLSSLSSTSSSGDFAQNLYHRATTADLQVGMYQRRHGRILIDLLDNDGNLYTLPDESHLRLKIGKEGKVPNIDLEDTTSSPNGSYISKGNPMLVVLDQLDTRFAPGVYDLQISVLDDDDANEITLIARGHFVLYASVGGGDLAIDLLESSLSSVSSSSSSVSSTSSVG